MKHNISVKPVNLSDIDKLENLLDIKGFYPIPLIDSLDFHRVGFLVDSDVTDVDTVRLLCSNACIEVKIKQ